MQKESLWLFYGTGLINVRQHLIYRGNVSMIKSDCPSSKGSNQDDALIKGSNDCSLFTSTDDKLVVVKNDENSASRKGSNLTIP